MTRTLRAVFDGKVLRPEGPLDLKPGAQYVVRIEHEVEGTKEPTETAYPLSSLHRKSGDVFFPGSGRGGETSFILDKLL